MTLNFTAPNGQIAVKNSSGSPAANMYLYTTDTLGNTNLRQSISYNGDISFYEDTGTTAKFFWDASAESLGIGTSSPSAKLDVAGTVNAYGNGSVALQWGNTSALGSLSFDGSANPVIRSASSKPLVFQTNGANERMRIDSSGNLLVGKTSAVGASTVGAEMRPNGDLISTRASAQPLTLNRTTSDGTIAQFRKDNTTVGSIGANGSYPYIGSHGTSGKGIKITDALLPATNSGAFNDANVNLGASNVRWKDLYLSGFTRYNTEVYVGDGASISGSYAANDLLLHTDNNPIVFRPNGTEAVRIDSSGKVGIGTSSPAKKLHVDSGSSSDIARFENDAGSFTLGKSANLGSLDMASDANFRIRHGSTVSATFKSDGNVGIGTSSPSELLSVYHATNSKVLISTGVNGASQIYFGDNGNDLAGRIYYDHNANSMRFHVNTNERMRIDSSGNFLVGQTTASSNTVGTSLRPDGRNFYCANNNYSAHFNRKSSDGAIAHFAKDDTIAGSIGVLNSNNLTISGTVADHGGLQFGTHCVIPMEANVDSDGTIDLGSSNSKFKDGHFSGSLYGNGSNLTGVGGSTTAGAVGTYTSGRPANYTTYTTGTTVAGSSLYISSGSAWYYAGGWQGVTSGGSNSAYGGNSTCSGTWRLMSYAGGSGNVGVTGLWVRIS
jgi:hypothetical protein